MTLRSSCGIGGQEGELEVVVEALALGLQRQQLIPGEARHLGVVAVLELLRLVDLLLDAAQLAVDAHDLVELGALLGQRLQLVEVGDDAGVGHLGGDRLVAFFQSA